MNVISDKKEMIFKNIVGDREYYSIGLSKQKLDGSYEKGYINCQFPKNVKLGNQTLINIKKAWIDFYIKDKKTIPYIFINEFEIIEENKKEEINENEKIKEIDPYEEMGKQIELTDSDLPF